MTVKEEKLIEEMINRSKEHCVDDVDYSVPFLINLIEKLSKEIEELKVRNFNLEAMLTSLNSISIDKKYVKNNYINKDKIKAKIETKLKELDEQINEEWKKYGNSKELQDMEDMYNFLQSLLEKE